MTSGTTFHSAVASHSALTLGLAADRSTKGSAGYSLRQPTAGSGSDRPTHPRRGDRQTAMVDPRDETQCAIRTISSVAFILVFG